MSAETTFCITLGSRGKSNSWVVWGKRNLEGDIPRQAVITRQSNTRDDGWSAKKWLQLERDKVVWLVVAMPKLSSE